MQSSFTLPLPAPRELMDGESPHTMADLVRSLQEDVGRLVGNLPGILQQVAMAEDLSPAGRAIAEELCGTTARLQELVDAYATVAGPLPLRGR